MSGFNPEMPARLTFDAQIAQLTERLVTDACAGLPEEAIEQARALFGVYYIDKDLPGNGVVGYSRQVPIQLLGADHAAFYNVGHHVPDATWNMTEVQLFKDGSPYVVINPDWGLGAESNEYRIYSGNDIPPTAINYDFLKTDRYGLPDIDSIDDIQTSSQRWGRGVLHMLSDAECEDLLAAIPETIPDIHVNGLRSDAMVIFDTLA